MNRSVQIGIILCLLAGLALYLAPQALHVGNTMRYVVLLTAAVILWRAAQRKHS